MATISTLTKHLSSGAAQRDRVRDQLGTAPSAPSAYDRLAAAQAAYGSLRDSTRSAVTGAFDITSAGGSIAAIIAQQAHALGGAQKFDTALEDLRKRGLSKDQVEAFAAKGPGALAQVLAIDKGSNAQIAQLNQQDAALAKVGDKLGSSIAQAYEGAGLKSAQSLVSGLKAKEKELSDLMDRLGDRIANKIANAAGTEKGVTRKGDGGRRQVVVRVGNHHSTHAVAKSVAAEVMRQLNQ
jgi:cell division septum initiation protein DivIVA